MSLVVLAMKSDSCRQAGRKAGLVVQWYITYRCLVLFIGSLASCYTLKHQNNVPCWKIKMSSLTSIEAKGFFVCCCYWLLTHTHTVFWLSSSQRQQRTSVVRSEICFRDCCLLSNCSVLCGCCCIKLAWAQEFVLLCIVLRYCMQALNLLLLA